MGGVMVSSTHLLNTYKLTRQFPKTITQCFTKAADSLLLTKRSSSQTLLSVVLKRQPLNPKDNKKGENKEKWNTIVLTRTLHMSSKEILVN